MLKYLLEIIQSLKLIIGNYSGGTCTCFKMEKTDCDSRKGITVKRTLFLFNKYLTNIFISYGNY